MSAFIDSYVSFGGGVQSTAIAMLCATRDPRLSDLLQDQGIPWPSTFVFADTGNEPEAVYDHLRDMELVFREAKIRYLRLSRGVLSDNVLGRGKTGRRSISTIPLFVRGKDGTMGPVRRKCTSDFKSSVLDRWAKDLYGGSVVAQWYGISSDEVQRMRISQDPWRTFYYPLVELRWSRQDCIEYLKGQTYTDGSRVRITKSACYFCPFRRPEEWARLRDQSPNDWAKALAFEQEITAIKLPGMKEVGYLTRTGESIATFATRDSHPEDYDMNAECAGVCGV